MASEARKVTLEFTQASEKLVRRVMLNVVANLVEDTPVDTGWARVNWIPRVGQPADDALPKTGDGSPGSELGNSGAREAGVLDIATRFKVGDTIYVSNNVPYISDLNDGRSPQAPAGYVQAGIERAIHGLDGVSLK